MRRVRDSLTDRELQVLTAARMGGVSTKIVYRKAYVMHTISGVQYTLMGKRVDHVINKLIKLKLMHVAVVNRFTVEFGFNDAD